MGATITSLRNVAELHLEVARACNLSCAYCYAAGREGDGPARMSLETASEAVDLILDQTSCSSLELVLHGGEPLLASVHWLEAVAAYAARAAHVRGKTVRLVMQSNLTLLTPGIERFLQEWDISVGSSIDDEPKRCDERRGHSSVTLQNARRLQSRGLLGGVICVVHKGNARRTGEVLAFLEKSGLPDVMMTICYSVGRAQGSAALDAEEIFAGYRGIYEYLVLSDGTAMVERTVAGKLARFIEPPNAESLARTLVCSHPVCGGGITTLYVDTSGDLYPCGLAVQDPALHLGTLAQHDSLHHKRVVSNMYDRMNEQRARCAECAAAAICDFGCPSLWEMDRATHAADCRATRMFYEYLSTRPAREISDVSSRQRELHGSRRS